MQSNRTLHSHFIAASLAILLLVLAGCSATDQSPPQTAPSTSREQPATQPTTPPAPSEKPEQAQKQEQEQERFFSLADVASHATKEDCWMVIHGNVYDVTAYVSSHPGGPAILQGCGKDATDLFETRPMGSGTPHSQGARNTLQSFLIGKLKP
ncbi:hypothetical protein D6783_02995 [Candidatus Woesearchaeota archaeon]|nr:MAG: hypothetical protein D6783_02995 [Candidatus Woesearchaeota archaeon]